MSDALGAVRDSTITAGCDQVESKMTDFRGRHGEERDERRLRRSQRQWRAPALRSRRETATRRSDLLGAEGRQSYRREEAAQASAVLVRIPVILAPKVLRRQIKQWV